MKLVAPLRYDVIFKKAFCDPEIFTAFVQAVLNIKIEIEKVETEKSFKPPIGRVASRFDLFAEDTKNRIIVDIQHKHYPDHYDAYLHYHCAAILEQVANAKDYHPNRAVYTIVVLTSGDKHKKDRLIIDFDPKDWDNQGVGEIPHKLVYLCPKYPSERTPAVLGEWLRAIDDTLDETVEESNYQNPLIQRIFDLIEQDEVSPEERARMIQEYNEERDIQQRESDALAKGRQNEKIDIARNLLRKGQPLAMIADVTGLSIEIVESLVVTG